ncbi:hypothetical protein PHYBLDRAFT_66929 [Phycomyces blakesleeanus NRRL 1555(-)]|uniref:Uncharacterized protein n=1 Tax=Phycomyces blakesleeanus (strain ATCC 8743b / DSM 1359 / FGSC 10004 / NBRC 33097 / NRRL 1555) TaxID=763407 RepID=A0A162TPS0_PHYB8|nr:hypothetical protein PHYBLDRAFT_66929 [Phycomyces blakesleeanus NRRL 1555(-)]OAD68823.1 hypothetical protein PHYBLDRAFT_66929 [Phycomyces blakesleeanus NRRL 1555(-)]|eukprot:XP_018286863.1 hypothetical protein PHYBLDRAFT_66929 [Phycomyces blakesleeanus NRRL 1555(-)]
MKDMVIIYIQNIFDIRISINTSCILSVPLSSLFTLARFYETHSSAHSDAPSSQQSSGLARMNIPLMNVPCLKNFHLMLPSLPCRDDITTLQIISWSAKKLFAFVKEIIISCFTINVLFLCPFVLGTSNKIFHPKYNKPAEQEVAEDIE